jgi:hypothetical protein
LDCTADEKDDGKDDGLLDFDGTAYGNTIEACLTQIDDGSLDLDGTGKGIKLHSSLDLDGKADGTADGLLDFNGTADGNDCLRIYQKYKNKQMGFFGLIPHGKV